ncbi:MAG: glycosyltransferase [Hymenobacter sp.]|nr:MAG: glycosyltransferase [Hymenobacter sp.]
MQSDAPKVSICIPAYNASRYIKEALYSIREQLYSNWEVIIVEDGSNDGTEEIVNNFKSEISQDVIYIKQKHNLGLSATRNTAVRFATGRWIALLDSDDLWDKNHLIDLVNISLAQPECNLIHSEVSVFDSATGSKLPSNFVSREAINQLPLSLFTGDYSIQPSAAMISRDLYTAIGGFEIRLRSCEDKEMWFKCIKAGCKFTTTGKATSYYRKHSNTLSAQTVNMAVSMAEVYSIYADWEDIPRYIRMRYAADAWLSAARITRSSDNKLAKIYLSKSFNYQKSYKQVCFWLLINFPLLSFLFKKLKQ